MPQVESEPEHKLTASKVHDIVTYCLFAESELVGGKPSIEPVTAVGLVMGLGFHPGRIAEKKAEVREMLGELPSEFKEGWSFLNMCNDKDGRQWGEHRDMDALVCLGLATGQLVFCAPREFWAVLPGGVPYVQVVESSDRGRSQT